MRHIKTTLIGKSSTGNLIAMLFFPSRFLSVSQTFQVQFVTTLVISVETLG